MRSAGLITYNTGTRKWSTDIDINNVKPENVDKLEKDETSKNAKNKQLKKEQRNQQDAQEPARKREPRARVSEEA